MKKYLIVGGAGFIGSHVVRLLLQDDSNKVAIFDNFSSGKMHHLETVKDNKNLKIIKADIKDIETLKKAMEGIDVVYHFASNPDISKAVTHPDIDFWEGTYLTNNVLEAMRINNVINLIYSSGSGVYGDAGYNEADEDYSPMLPISTYGASKLACEALISAYCFMFDMNAGVFRFANVVGPNQTHGVGFDFIRKLQNNNKILEILGDGRQSKSYIYVNDIILALRMIEQNYLKGYVYFNVATKDYITVKDIADIVVDVMDLKNVEYKFTGGDRGWKGDVPVVRINSEKIRKLGWQNRYSSKESIYESVKSMYKDALENKFGWKGEQK